MPKLTVVKGIIRCASSGPIPEISASSPSVRSSPLRGLICFGAYTSNSAPRGRGSSSSSRQSRKLSTAASSSNPCRPNSANIASTSDLLIRLSAILPRSSSTMMSSVVRSNTSRRALPSIAHRRAGSFSISPWTAIAIPASAAAESFARSISADAIKVLLRVTLIMVSAISAKITMLRIAAMRA